MRQPAAAKSSAHYACLAAAAAAFACAAPAHGQAVPVAVNSPATVSGAVVPGARSLDITFAVAGADGLRLELIVPVNGATLTLLDPAGKVAVAPGDARVSFRPGSANTPPLPGGVFEVADIAEPADGTWTIRLAFPAAPDKTVALGTVFARSRYAVGVATERDTLLVGEDVSVGLLVLDNGKPITGLAPTITLSRGTPRPAADDGRGADGKANDGVYSIDHTFRAPGDYTITGSVAIPTPKGTLQRTATTRVKAVPPRLDNARVSLATRTGAHGCVAALKVLFRFNVLDAARYVTLVRLAAPNGRTVDVRKAADYGIGAGSVTAEIPAADLRAKLGTDGPYTVALVDALEVGGSEFTLAFRKRDAGTFDTRLAQLCTNPIELQPRLAAAPVPGAGGPERLRLRFPVAVAQAGPYRISFKVIGPRGEDIGFVDAARTLAAGPNDVEVELASARLREVAGPYRAISLLVMGGGASARLATLGTIDAGWRRAAQPGTRSSPQTR